MWKLTIEDDEGKKTPLPLVRDEYGLGRDADNAVRLTERNISRKHAVLKQNGKGWKIEDLNSYNGSYVNGTRVAGDVEIGHGDVIQLGDYRIELSDDAVAAASTSAVTVPQPGAGGVAARPDRLVMLVGPTPGQEYPLDVDRLTIGRGDDAGITIQHTSVSRLHAEVHSLGEGRYEIVDKGSANGVRVNGSDLRRGLIEAGDVIELGDIRLKFVGAGQAFRPGVEASQQIAAVPYESDVPSIRVSSYGTDPPPRKNGLGKAVFVGAAVAVLAIGGFVALRPGKGGDAAPVGSAVGAASDMAVVLDGAKKLAADGKLDDAHQKLGAIPSNSSLRDSADFRLIEQAWGDSLLAHAVTEPDPSSRRAMLTQVAQATTLDADRRKRANDMLLQLDSKGTDISRLPAAAAATDTAAGNPRPVLAPNPFVAAAPTAPAGATAGSPPAPVGTPTTAAAIPPPTPPPATTPAAAPTTTTTGKGTTSDMALQGKDGEAKARAALEPRVWSGRASLEDMKMLRAICRHMGDHACADRVSGMIKEKQAQAQ